MHLERYKFKHTQILMRRSNLRSNLSPNAFQYSRSSSRTRLEHSLQYDRRDHKFTAVHSSVYELCVFLSS